MLYYIFQDIPVHMPSDDVLDLYNDLYLTLGVSYLKSRVVIQTNEFLIISTITRPQLYRWIIFRPHTWIGIGHTKVLIDHGTYAIILLIVYKLLS